MCTAKHVMTKNVISIPSGTLLGDVARLLLDKGISGAPVTAADGRLVGIISEYNLLEMIYIPQLRARTVDELMTKEVHTVGVDTELSEVANLFIVRRIRRVPVLENGKLVGIISRPELLRYLLDGMNRGVAVSLDAAALSQGVPSRSS